MHANVSNNGFDGRKRTTLNLKVFEPTGDISALRLWEACAFLTGMDPTAAYLDMFEAMAEHPHAGPGTGRAAVLSI